MHFAMSALRKAMVTIVRVRWMLLQKKQPSNEAPCSNIWVAVEVSHNWLFVSQWLLQNRGMACRFIGLQMYPEKDHGWPPSPPPNSFFAYFDRVNHLAVCGISLIWVFALFVTQERVWMKCSFFRLPAHRAQSYKNESSQIGSYTYCVWDSEVLSGSLRAFSKCFSES